MSQAEWIEDPIDLLYLTGLPLSRGLLLRTHNERALFVDGRYYATAQKNAPCPTFLWDDAAPSHWLRERDIKTLAFDSAKTSVDRFEALKKKTTGLKLTAVSSLLKRERALKSPQEIARLRAAACLTLRGIEHIQGLLAPGISEEEIAWAFELFVRKQGASGLSFEPIIAFGENSAYPHHRAGKTRLQPNQIVLMDVGAILENYRGDLTRIHRFGHLNHELEDMIRWTLEAKAAAEALVRPGTLVETLDLTAKRVFGARGVEALFVHGLGHGVGLETHEFPSLKATGPDAQAPLEVGMVITIEPGLYRPGLGGVRIEDMLVVTETGAQKLVEDC